MGELYEERSDRDKAAAVYSRLRRLWERADPELQAVVVPLQRRPEPPGPPH